jgi:Ca-activated chloride channel family protein
VIILISDGEDHEEHTLEAAKKIKESGAKLYVIGVGTQKGGPIPVKDNSGNRVGFKRDHQSQPVISEFHPNDLLEIATAAGGRYWSSSPSESEVGELSADIGSLTRVNYSERKYLVYEDRFQIPLGIGLFFLFFELFIPARKMRKSVLALLLVIGVSSSPSRASPVGSIDTYEENEQGLELYKQKKFEEAQKQFGEAQAHDPGKPELDFNQGVAQLQQGNADAASESFKNAAIEAGKRHNQDLEGKSLYNLGEALTKKGDLKGAAKAYLSSINSSQIAKDAKLEAQARKNLELLTQEKKKQDQKKPQDQKQSQDQKKDQQQNQQAKQDKQGKDDDQGKKDQPNEKQDQKQAEKQEQKPDRQDNQGQQNQTPPKNQDGSQKPQFNSKKLSGQDAERVINELKDHEKQLQNNLKSRHAQVQETEKDW